MFHTSCRSNLLAGVLAFYGRFVVEYLEVPCRGMENYLVVKICETNKNTHIKMNF